MPQRIPGIFEKYVFTDEAEILGAMTFQPLQLMYLQTLQATVSQELIGLSAEGSKFANPEIFLREHQHLRGKIELLEELISVHDNLQSEQARRLKAEATLQAYREAMQQASSN